MRKMPVRSRELELDGEYEGWKVTVRLNPPIRAFGDVVSGEFDRIIEGMSKILLGWNFVDEEGQPLSPPSSESIGELPVELLSVVADRFAKEAAQLPPDLKDQS